MEGHYGWRRQLLLGIVFVNLKKFAIIDFECPGLGGIEIFSLFFQWILHEQYFFLREQVFIFHFVFDWFCLDLLKVFMESGIFILDINFL